MNREEHTGESLAIYPDRLTFMLKSFVRIAWASKLAEDTWSSRFSRVRDAVLGTEWMSVVRKARPCALFQLRSQDIEMYSTIWAAQGLESKTLTDAIPRIGAWWLDATLSRRTVSHAVVVGSGRENAAFERAWEVGDRESIGELLGYPACCRRFFGHVCVTQRCIDTVWAMSGPEPRFNGGTDGLTVSGRIVDGPVASNIMLQSLGIRAIPHCPCSFGCSRTAQLATDMADVATAIGYQEEYRWLSSILSWPAEWSALHGIAEIRTPVVKICTPTDSTAGKYIVRWTGSAPPREGARGIGFPYASPNREPGALIRLEGSR
jgi:hypothetical protein